MSIFTIIFIESLVTHFHSRYNILYTTFYIQLQRNEYYINGEMNNDRWTASRIQGSKKNDAR